MQFTYYGHSTFAISIGGMNILFDPFVTYNELAKNIVDINTIKADIIFVSHGHEDHVADLVPIAKRTGALVVSNWEICGWLNTKGIPNTHPMNIGGSWKFDFGTVKCVSAVHSSGLPDASYGGTAMGFIVKTAEGDVYYSGDTALTLDMQLIPTWSKLKYAILPIGDNFTMDINDAVAAAKMVQCSKIIGVHYDTFGYIKIDKEAAVQSFKESDITLLLPAINETIELS